MAQNDFAKKQVIATTKEGINFVFTSAKSRLPVYAGRFWMTRLNFNGLRRGGSGVAQGWLRGGSGVAQGGASYTPVYCWISCNVFL